jgi:uncharacterized phiE125 gp8 family phage protein
MNLTRLTQPDSEPVTLNELKAWLRFTGDDMDVMLAATISAARQDAEQFLGLSIGNSKWRAVFDAFGAEMALPMGPVASIESVSYRAPDGTAASFSDYTSSGDVLIPDYLPETLGINAVTVEYTGGIESEPEALKNAALMLAQSQIDSLAEQPPHLIERARALLRPYARRQTLVAA